MFIHPQIKFNIKNLGLFFRKVSEEKLKKKLANFFPNRHILFTDLGRSAFQIAIKELGLENSEMLIPAYICDIFKPILQHYNIKPIYLDINLETFHADLSGIESRITPQTKSILICHTYGLPVEMDKILEIARKYNLKIIEDCAHLPIGLPRTQLRGDCAFFSFAKLFPVVNGGMLVSKNPIKTELPKYKPRLFNVIRFLRLFPVLAKISELFRKAGGENLKNNREEKPKKISKKSLKALNYYLDNYQNQISKRINLAEYFQKKLKAMGFEVQEFKNNAFTYLSALVPKNINRDELVYKLKKKNIFCSRIWQNPLFNGLPNTSETSKRIINLPMQNWFTLDDIDKVIKFLKIVISENKPISPVPKFF